MSRARHQSAAALRRGQTDETLVAIAQLLPELDDELPDMRQRGPRGREVLTDEEIERQYYDWSHRKALAIDHERMGIVPTGKRALPIDLRLIELRAKVSTELLELERYIAAHMTDTGTAADAGDVARIDRIRTMLKQLHVDDVEEHTAARVDEIPDLVRSAIDPPHRRQVGACPWCGRQSLEVDFDTELITCATNGCSCSRDDCKCPIVPHRWPRNEWEQLAQQCVTADAARSQVTAS